MVDTHLGNSDYYKADQLKDILLDCGIKPEPPGPADPLSNNKPVVVVTQPNLPDLDTLAGFQPTAVPQVDANHKFTGKALNKLKSYITVHFDHL